MEQENVIVKELNAIENDLQQLMTASKQENAQAAIENALADFDARFSGTLAPRALAAMRDEHEVGARRAYDADLAAKAEAWETRNRAFQQSLSKTLAVLREAPREPNAQIDAMRELAALQRYQGRTRAELFQVYEQTPDSVNPTLIRMLERDLPAFRPADDPQTDVETIMRFREAITARETARLGELVDVETRAKNLTRPIAVSHLLSHLRSGRGFAITARPALHVVGE